MELSHLLLYWLETIICMIYLLFKLLRWAFLYYMCVWTYVCEWRVNDIWTRMYACMLTHVCGDHWKMEDVDISMWLCLHILEYFGTFYVIILLREGFSLYLELWWPGISNIPVGTMLHKTRIAGVCTQLCLAFCVGARIWTQVLTCLCS